MGDDNNNFDAKEEKIEFMFERHKVFSSFNKDPRTEREQDDMKKFKRGINKIKKSKKSGSEASSLSGSTKSLERTESQLSARSDLSGASSASVSSYASVKLQKESRQFKLMEEWANNFGTTWSIVELAGERMQLIGDLRSWSPTDVERKELEEEFARCEETFQMTRKLGTSMTRDDLIDEENRALVQRDLDTLEQKWTKVKEHKDSAQVSRVEHQLENKGRFDRWKSELDASMVWIKEKANELDSIDDLESSLVMLEDAATKMESLYMGINNYQDKIDSVVQAGSKIIKDEEVESEAVPSIKSDIRSLESTWELLREKCTAVQLSIKEKVAIRQMQEKEYMAEWNETHIKIDDWLTNAENEATLFDTAHENIVGVEDQVTEHEELVFRLATEEKTINDMLEVGESLAGEKLRIHDNKLQVKNDLKLLKKRKTKLNARLIGQQESLTSFLDHLAKIESEAFQIWLNHCKAVEEEILNLGTSTGEENLDTVDGAKDFIATETALLTDIEALQTDVDGVVGEAHALVEADQLGKLKRQGVKTASKSLQDLYEKRKSDATLKLKEIQEELLNMQQQQADQVAKWINKCETLDRWIDSETKELETLLTFPEEEATLDKVIEEEQAIREIKSNVDSRTSILEALVEEGGILKENKNIEVDYPEEYSHIIELMVGSQYKWEVLNKNINEKISRVINILSQMQGQLLSACKTQIEDLENAVNGLGPISEGYDTLAKDAEVLSEIFMMIGQTRANVARFDKYANEIQTSEDLSNAEKFEVRDANETLHHRILALSSKADERQNLLHEKIIDVLTESLVALNDTVSSLEEKCDEIMVPDNLETVDLVERYSTLEDLLNRLIACELSLKDIKGLGKAADDFMILESGEPDDIMREIENRNVFINHVQQMAREKRSRIYGLMVYTFKRRIEELDNLLSSIEEGLKEETESSQDIPSVLAKIKNNESSLQELDDIQKNGEEVTLQANEIIEANVISDQDKVELQEKNSAFVDHLSEVFTALKMQHNNLNQSLSSVVKDKLAELREWLNLMDKRREGDDQIGPDSMTIKKQITEMNVVESQLKEKRLTPYIHHDDEIAIQCLDPETLQDLKEADHDWNHLAEWIAHRTKVLHATQDAWENFRQVEVDLLDYLRDKERQIKNWEPINLEDEEAVAERLILLKAMLSGMEDHKDDVSNMHKAADEVIDLIGSEIPMANNIKSQVADIHDCWNSTVRQVIEAISKLNFAKEKLLSMEEGMNEIRSWLDDAKSILKFYTEDVTEDTMEDLKPSLEEKRSQEESKRRTLRKVNSLSQELLEDIDGPSHDAIRADVTNLNKDWNEVTTDLEKKREVKKKSCCGWCYRRWFLKYGYYN